MYILGIESSCDESGVALVKFDRFNAAPVCAGSLSFEPELPQLLAHALHTQIEMHQPYGGVVPELASRDHIQRIIPLLNEVLSASGVGIAQVDLVAYTKGPGLAGALLVGAGVAASLAASMNLPLLGIHHLEGHLLSPFLSANPPTFPFVCLLVSGGHTQLMRVQSMGQYELLGESVDDAAGEAFDKSAKLLGLDYPGGAALSKLAALGNPKAFNFPRPLMHSGRLDFSFAGLKTSVLTQVNKMSEKEIEASKNDLAASVQAAIVEVLVKKSLMAIKQTKLKTLVVAGGVGANQSLRETLSKECSNLGGKVYFPELYLCTDNGAMIAMAAAMRVQYGIETGAKHYGFDVKPRWSLAELVN
ncbi:MAG: tRNA (adenosine(37)-N6)-threonylcarbamoyltransferase complex transferase subunit TsaD [Burkholderiaceae bacterium]